MQTLFGIHLFHPARDFGRNCGPTARRDIAAGVQKRLTPGAASAPGGGDLDHWLLRAESEQQAAQQQQSSYRGREHSQTFACLRDPAGTVINP